MVKTTNDVYCPYGYCVIWVGSDGKIEGGVGPLECACDRTPGWNSEWLEGMGKPHPPVKAIGRHGSKVIRSRKRHIVAPIASWIYDV